jgi:triosephosphate isomerase
MVVGPEKLSRGALMVGNWKMAMTQSASVALSRRIHLGISDRKLDQVTNLKVGIAPSPMCVRPVIEGLGGYFPDARFLVGGQSFYAEEGVKDGNKVFIYEGAFTGETSLPQLLESGAQFSILGHSELRAIDGYGVKGLNLTDKMLNKRLLAGLEFVGEQKLSNFFFIYCVGETLAQREAKQEISVLRGQIETGLNNVASADIVKVRLAYEPVWAIGTGKTATAKQANDMAAWIRELIESQYGREVADRQIVQYGGSMNPKNVTEFMSQPDIDGGLIGGAALKVDEFLGISQQTAELYKG